MEDAEPLHTLIDQAGLSTMLMADLLAIIHRIDPEAVRSRSAELEAQLRTCPEEMLPWLRKRLAFLSQTPD